jgi:hypothetical protein
VATSASQNQFLKFSPKSTNLFQKRSLNQFGTMKPILASYDQLISAKVATLAPGSQLFKISQKLTNFGQKRSLNQFRTMKPISASYDQLVPRWQLWHRRINF